MSIRSVVTDHTKKVIRAVISTRIDQTYITTFYSLYGIPKGDGFKITKHRRTVRKQHRLLREYLLEDGIFVLWPLPKNYIRNLR